MFVYGYKAILSHIHICSIRNRACDTGTWPGRNEKGNERLKPNNLLFNFNCKIMKGKLMMLLACLFMGASVVTAQVSKVTGLVIGAEDGEPVIGATVAVKGVPTLGAITDLDGKFVIENLPSSAKTLYLSSPLIAFS